MQQKCVLGLVVILCLWLAGNVRSVQGADADPFEAADLERFPRDVSLPEVSLPDLAEQNVSLRSFKGQVVLINFWTTW